MTFINYAHRGASSYQPENTMPSFRLGWEMGANGVETDIQKTRDGKLVLFHDNDLLRIFGRPEAIHDLSWEELQSLEAEEPYAGTKIPSLTEFLEYFFDKPVCYAIEIKETGLEAELINLLKKYSVYGDKLVITSGIWGSLCAVHKIDPDIHLGYLAKKLTKKVVECAHRCGIWQICPKASILDENWNRFLREEGFSVRAWGIDCEETMNRMLDMNVDGMTVNFPDLLVKEQKKRGLISGMQSGTSGLT